MSALAESLVVRVREVPEEHPTTNACLSFGYEARVVMGIYFQSDAFRPQGCVCGKRFRAQPSSSFHVPLLTRPYSLSFTTDPTSVEEVKPLRFKLVTHSILEGLHAPKTDKKKSRGDKRSQSHQHIRRLTARYA